MGIRKVTTIFLIFFSFYALGFINESDFQNINARNFLLFNAGFENGTQGWTKSGPSITVTSTSGQGGYATWDPTASGQYIQSPPISIGGAHLNYNSLGGGKNLVAVVDFFNPISTISASYEMQVFESGLTLASVTLPATTSSGFHREYLNFIDDNSGSIKYIRIKTNADEPGSYFDNFGVYEASMVNISNVSSAQFIGSAYIAGTAACVPSRTSTTVGAFTADADCPGPTVLSNPGPGIIQTTDSNLPQFTVNNLPAGRYRVRIGGASQQASNTNIVAGLAISDGTTTCPQAGQFNGAAQANPTDVECNFEYLNAGNRTFELHGSTASGTLNLNMSSERENLKFDIYRYPTQAEQAYKASTIAQSWSGYHDNTCSWARTNTAYGDPTADASCALTERTNRNFGTVATNGSALPGIVFNAPTPGKYQIGAAMKVSSGTAAAVADFQLISNTITLASSQQAIGDANTVEFVDIRGMLNVSTPGTITVTVQDKISSGTITIAANGTTNSSAIEWSVLKIDQVIPAPLIKNSVVNSSDSVTTSEYAKINCDAGSAIMSQRGSWVSSLGNAASGTCAITLSASAFSGIDYCSVVDASVTGDPSALSVSITSSTVITSDCVQAGGTTDCTSYDFYLNCVGTK